MEVVKVFRGMILFQRDEFPRLRFEFFRHRPMRGKLRDREAVLRSVIRKTDADRFLAHRGSANGIAIDIDVDRNAIDIGKKFEERRPEFVHPPRAVGGD